MAFVHKTGGAGPHLIWLAVAGCAVASVFMVNALAEATSKWIWIVQAFTPFFTINGLGNVVPAIHAGEGLTVVAACSSVLTVPVLLLLYTLLLLLGSPASVFWIALLAKLALWMVGHGMIWNGQAKVREKSRQYARVDMEDTDDLAKEGGGVEGQGAGREGEEEGRCWRAVGGKTFAGRCSVVGRGCWE